MIGLVLGLGATYIMKKTCCKRIRDHRSIFQEVVSQSRGFSSTTKNGFVISLWKLHIIDSFNRLEFLHRATHFLNRIFHEGTYSTKQSRAQKSICNLMNFWNFFEWSDLENFLSHFFSNFRAQMLHIYININISILIVFSVL